MLHKVVFLRDIIVTHHFLTLQDLECRSLFFVHDIFHRLSDVMVSASKMFCI